MPGLLNATRADVPHPVARTLRRSTRRVQRILPESLKPKLAKAVAEPPEESWIQLTIKGFGRGVVKMDFDRNAKLSELIFSFWELTCQPPHPAAFIYKGNKLRARDTPTMLEMKDNDIIEYRRLVRHPRLIQVDDMLLLIEAGQQFVRKMDPIVEWERLDKEEAAEYRATVHSIQLFFTKLQKSLKALIKNEAFPLDAEAARVMRKRQVQLANMLVRLFRVHHVVYKHGYTASRVHPMPFRTGARCLLAVENLAALASVVRNLQYPDVWERVPLAVPGLLREYPEPVNPVEKTTTIADGNGGGGVQTQYVPKPAQVNYGECLICYEACNSTTNSTRVFHKNGFATCTDCCGKTVHPRCLARWFAYERLSTEHGDTGTCPACRHVFPPKVAMLIMYMAIAHLGLALDASPKFRAWIAKLPKEGPGSYLDMYRDHSRWTWKD
ncbi:SUMO protein smt3 [Knufia peltigerae]|uniref:SUMO protein smt3 n=1 Tax=Knufia peltigerae TaxID=1002370 RepID=A0AA38XZD0_9EURO|nr:SUMO protein smt3 [Knufia peltigerae]